MTTDSTERPFSIGSKFWVEWDGTLNAAAGKFTGEINATSGKFTGTIESSKITGSTISSSYIANSDKDPTFSVDSHGNLIANSAIIGGWYVRPTTTNGQYSLYSKDDDFELNPNSGALKMKNITIDGTSGKITLGSNSDVIIDGGSKKITLGPNKDVVIDGTYKEITLGTGATATVVTSTGLATSTISIYSK
jgi:hypothetical protein